MKSARFGVGIACILVLGARVGSAQEDQERTRRQGEADRTGQAEQLPFAPQTGQEYVFQVRETGMADDPARVKSPEERQRSGDAGRERSGDEARERDADRRLGAAREGDSEHALRYQLKVRPGAGGAGKTFDLEVGKSDAKAGVGTTGAVARDEGAPRRSSARTDDKDAETCRFTVNVSADGRIQRIEAADEEPRSATEREDPAGTSGERRPGQTDRDDETEKQAKMAIAKKAIAKKVEKHLPLILGSGLHSRALSEGEAVKIECPTAGDATSAARSGKDKPELKAKFQGKTGDSVRFTLTAADSKAGRLGEDTAPDTRTEAEKQRRTTPPAGANANERQLGYATYNAKDGLVETLSIQMPHAAARDTGSTPTQPDRAVAASQARLEIRRVEGAQRTGTGSSTSR